MKTIPVSLVLLASTGCPYSFPKPNEPHAIVKLRRVYHKTPGTFLLEHAAIDRLVGFRRRVDSSQAEAAATDAIRVHPEQSEWRWTSDFKHSEQKRVKEKYKAKEMTTEPEQVAKEERYSCGEYQTCTRTVYRTELVTKYREVEKERWVTKDVFVRDGGCDHEFTLTPVKDHIYLLQISYVGGDICSITCLEQLRAGAKLRNQPCSKPVYHKN